MGLKHHRFDTVEEYENEYDLKTPENVVVLPLVKDINRDWLVKEGKKRFKKLANFNCKKQKQN